MLSLLDVVVTVLPPEVVVEVSMVVVVDIDVPLDMRDAHCPESRMLVRLAM